MKIRPWKNIELLEGLAVNTKIYDINKAAIDE